MSDPVIISGEVVGEDTLRQWLADTERLTGAKITITPQWLVHSENDAVNLALAALFGGVTASDGIRLKAKKVKAKAKGETPAPVKPAFKLNPAPPREVKAWRVLDADGKPVEWISLEERNRRLARGDFAEGTVLHHPKAGKHKITKSGPGQGMEPVNS